jgi:hypothetical protein
MQSHAGAARWSRLTLAALLVVLAPLHVDAIADDIGIAVLETNDDPGPGDPVAETVTTPADLVAPQSLLRPAPATRDERAAVSAIAIRPTDRAPPRV